MMTIHRIPVRNTIFVTFGGLDAMTSERTSALFRITAMCRNGDRAHYSPVTRKWTVVFRFTRKAVPLPGYDPFRCW